MPSETPFRIAVVVLMLGSAATAAFHRSRARTSQRITHHDEGLLFAAVLRLFGLGLWISTVAYLIDPRWTAWAALPLPVWARWSAVALAAAAAMLLHWTFAALGKNITDTVVTRKNAELVTSGPYRWVRHPLYATAGLLMISVSLVAANGLIAVCSIVVLAMLIVRTPHEEQRLLETFGDAYREYMRTTGRFWPRLS